MPGVGVTDAERIFALVGAHRGRVLASSVLQLFSAACYAPAAVALVIALALLFTLALAGRIVPGRAIGLGVLAWVGASQIRVALSPLFEPARADANHS